MINLEPTYIELPTVTKPITVSNLNKNAKILLEENFNNIFVTGEISNCSRPSSGHYYFSLKDKTSQISCAMFLGYQGSLKEPLKDGMQVNLRGSLSIYSARGSYQIIVSYLENAGLGKLQLEFERLKIKLQQEGLFENKKPIPKYPAKIGVVTSATGAAIADILFVLKSRYPMGEVIIYPTLVQGDEAAPNIIAAIETANSRAECDVLIIARGGGSIEDLWAFNIEAVARAVAASNIPTISGVGHEVDFTICDFSADLRAATPSQAAQFASVDQAELKNTCDMLSSQLQRAYTNHLQAKKLELSNLKKQLRHPLEKIQNLSQMLDGLQSNLEYAWNNVLQQKRSQLENLKVQLESISPTHTLERGWAIISKNRKAISSIEKLSHGSEVDVKLKDGSFTAKITDINKEK